MLTHERIPGMLLLSLHEERTVSGEYPYELCFCAAGKCVCTVSDACVRLLPEQLMLCRSARQAPAVLTGRESGIRLLFDPERMQLPFLDRLSPEAIVSRLCSECSYLVFSSQRGAAAARELTASGEDTARVLLKTAELLLVLRDLPEDGRLQPPTCRSAELELALSVFRFAMQNPGERITVAVLAEHAGVSPTLLKESFRHVYGAPIYTVIRAEKMHRAAEELLATNCRVSDMASRFGYDNCSKFSKAFSNVMGMTPSVYRRTV